MHIPIKTAEDNVRLPGMGLGLGAGALAVDSLHRTLAVDCRDRTFRDSDLLCLRATIGFYWTTESVKAGARDGVEFLDPKIDISKVGKLLDDVRTNTSGA